MVERYAEEGKPLVDEVLNRIITMLDEISNLVPEPAKSRVKTKLDEVRKLMG